MLRIIASDKDVLLAFFGETDKIEGYETFILSVAENDAVSN